MDDPQAELKSVVRQLVETRSASEMLEHVDKYFSQEAYIVHPLVNSPQEMGKPGVMATYKMLRVLTLGNKVDFHAVCFEKVVTKKGAQHMVAMIDLTEHLQLRFLPLPTSYNPWFAPRFLIRVDLRKDDGDDKWYIARQEDNLPTDLGNSGLKIPLVTRGSDMFKWAWGHGTALLAAILQRYRVLD